jgi:uncharacterized protein (DUF433 family)
MATMASSMTLEALTRPAYTVADAARWARTTRATARRWVEGYEFKGPSGRAHRSPAVTGKRPEERYLTFEDLVEVAAVARARESGMSLQGIRQGLDFAKQELGIARPLLSERLLTDGRALFLDETRNSDQYVNLNRFGQVAWKPIEDVLKTIEYERGAAARWWPRGKNIDILIDPQVNFGRPVLAPLGVRTETLVDRFDGGEEIEDLAEEYGTKPALIQEALRFENRFGSLAA